MSESPILDEALVELTAPDGRVFRFRYGATIPYAGEEYVVLLEMDDDANGEEQILITRVIEQDGELSFVVAEEDDVIEAVFAKYTDMKVRLAADALGLVDGDGSCGCGCGQEHHHHDGCSCDHGEDSCDCGCGHEHHHHDGCSCHHGEDSCDCGCGN